MIIADTIASDIPSLRQEMPQKIISNKHYQKEKNDSAYSKEETDSLSSSLVGKKQIRTINESVYQQLKKRKYDIKSYYITREEAKNEIITKGSYLNVKLIHQYNSSTLTVTSYLCLETMDEC